MMLEFTVGINIAGKHESVTVGACLGADRTEHIRASPKRLETGSNILHTPNFQCGHRKAGGAGRCLNLTHIPQGDRIAGIGQNRKPAKSRDNLACGSLACHRPLQGVT